MLSANYAQLDYTVIIQSHQSHPLSFLHALLIAPRPSTTPIFTVQVVEEPASTSVTASTHKERTTYSTIAIRRWWWQRSFTGWRWWRRSRVARRWRWSTWCRTCTCSWWRRGLLLLSCLLCHVLIVVFWSDISMTMVKKKTQGYNARKETWKGFVVGSTYEGKPHNHHKQHKDQLED